jgi:hypothetical protein
MDYHVAIKFAEYTAEFTFNTPEERDEFIQVTRAMHPEMEIICSEAHKSSISA